MRQISSINEKLKNIASRESFELSGRPRVVEDAQKLADRSGWMHLLMEHAPDQALALALDPHTLTRLKLLFPDSASQLEERGAWSGSITEWIEDHHDRNATRRVVSLRSGELDFQIHFVSWLPERLKSGDRAVVEGLRLGTRIVVASANVEAETIPANGCSSIGEQRIAVLLTRFPGLPSPAVAAEELRQIFFGEGSRSLAGYWRSASYGKTWATGDVFGWLDLDRVYGCGEIGRIRDAALTALAKNTDLSKYNRFFIYFPGSCESVLGFGQLGCSNGFSSVLLPIHDPMPSEVYVQVAAHEGGHNLGLNEGFARSYRPEVLGPPDQGGLRSIYDDPFTTMGNFAGMLGHYNAREKLQLGWLTLDDIVVVEQPGSYSLTTLADSGGGAKALKIRRTGTNGWLWAEYRQPSDPYEATLPPEGLTGALLHYEDNNNRDTVVSAGSTDLLDFTPNSANSVREDFRDGAMVVGRIWSDPWSPGSLSVTAANGYSITLQVEENSCVSRIQPSSTNFGPSGAVVNFAVSAPAGCEWDVRISEPWIILTSPGNGSGEGTVSCLVTATDVLSRRTATIAVGRRSVQIVQEGLNKPPSGTSVHPASGIGYSEVFTFTYSDPNGADDIALVGSDIYGEKRYCAFTLTAETSRLQVRAGSRDGTFLAYASGLIGSEDVLETPDCSVDLNASSFSRVNDELRVRLALRFKAILDGRITIGLWAADKTGMSGNVSVLGDWIVGVQ